MRKLIYLLLLLLGASCSDKNLIEQQNEVSSFVTTRAAGDNLYDLLGYGYDCTYSNLKGSDYGKARVIDLDKFISGKGYDVQTGQNVNLEPGNINIAIIHGGGDSDETWGFDLNEYKESLNVQNSVSITVNEDSEENKDVKLFTAEVKKFYNDSARFTSSYSFYRLNAYKITRKLTMSNVYPEFLKYFLSDEFIYDLKHLTGKQLVLKYGTHVLTDIKLGGMGSVIFNAKMTSKENASYFKIEASSFFDILTTTDSYESINSKFQNFKDVRIRVKTIGGTLPINTQISYNAFNGELGNISFNYQDWLKSVDVNSEQLIGVGNPTTTVYFLSDFIDDPIKKKEVQDAIIEYCNSQLVIMEKTTTIDYATFSIYTYFKDRTNYEELISEYFPSGGKSKVSKRPYTPSERANTIFNFNPYGEYYRIVMYSNDNYVLEPDMCCRPINETAQSQLWDIEYVSSRELRFRNVSNNFYLGHDLMTNHPKNPYNKDLIWLIRPVSTGHRGR